MAARRRGARDISDTVDETTRHAVPGLAAPKPISLAPVMPPPDPQPQQEPPAAAAHQPAPAADTNTETAQPPAPPASAPNADGDAPHADAATNEDTAASTRSTEDQPPAPTPAERATRVPAPRRDTPPAADVGPTSLRNREPRTKHTITILRATATRLLKLQYEETMGAGSEQPKWPHIDAALAVLHPDVLRQQPGGLDAWIDKAEPLLEEHRTDDFVSEGALMRVSTKEAVRTLRVRLKMAGAAHVGAQYVITAALEDYLDKIGAPKLNKVPARQAQEDWLHD